MSSRSGQLSTRSLISFFRSAILFCIAGFNFLLLLSAQRKKQGLVRRSYAVGQYDTQLAMEVVGGRLHAFACLLQGGEYACHIPQDQLAGTGQPYAARDARKQHPRPITTIRDSPNTGAEPRTGRSKDMLHLGPQVDDAGVDPGQGVFVLADLCSSGAFYRTDDGDLSARWEHHRVVEVGVTGDETATCRIRVAAARTCIGIERTGDQLYAGRAWFRRCCRPSAPAQLQMVRKSRKRILMSTPVKQTTMSSWRRAIARPKVSGRRGRKSPSEVKMGAAAKTAGGRDNAPQRHPDKHQRQDTTSPEALVQVLVWVSVPLLISVEPA